MIIHPILNCTSIVTMDSKGFSNYRNVCVNATMPTRGHGIGAGFYVIIVIVFYGTSVMFLIASHIKRKHKKILEDRQINSYLKEFQIVRETSSKDSYRTLKRNMIAYLIGIGLYGGQSNTGHSTIYRCLSKTLLPITAIALSPTGSITSLLSRRNSLESNGQVAHNRSGLQSIVECDELLNGPDSPRDQKDLKCQTLTNENLHLTNKNYLHQGKQTNILRIDKETDTATQKQRSEMVKFKEHEKLSAVNFTTKQQPPHPLPTIELNRHLIPNRPSITTLRNATQGLIRTQVTAGQQTWHPPPSQPARTFQRSNSSRPTIRREYYDVQQNRRTSYACSSPSQHQQGRYVGIQSIANTTGLVGNTSRKSLSAEKHVEQISSV
ncbi:hypothetical protein HELRODRAFT_188786 [Helobdella robusta]|uniref:Uncharacterized protein n=1 Tax=Helobdella robusta TaxID=6412 RepID=T1FQC9_HELRO|nr:hypothetical protein HELRODRAFT_188786 [Helobdella robusta]ESO02638.1 hypothetical protein HELRODRAFT_188786 [Helobdella robusta]